MALSLPPSLVTVAYLAASVLFIFSLGGLSQQRTARRGNLYGVIGMGLALLATALAPGFGGRGGTAWFVLAAAVIPGAALGIALARRVAMTAMPELVAVLHSFVGLAAVLVGVANHLGGNALTGVEQTIHAIEVEVGVAVGAYTFTGSVLAFLKLRGSVSGKPWLLPLRHALNAAVVLGCVGLGAAYVSAGGHGLHGGGDAGLWPLLGTAALAGLLGLHMVAAIGGADMPVVVSMLNSYSGWAAAAAGFMLANDLLIVTGALVGSSGAILSIVMCRGMNRSFLSVIAGGFGTDGGASSGAATAAAPVGDVTAIDVDGCAALLRAAQRVVIVPGYGLAQAQAQAAIAEIVRVLRAGGKHVAFAIHPVAGRLPGHMNVLLAEARVPYDIVLEMDEIQGDLPRADVVLVVGANDIVNPGAIDDPASPIAGMPVLHVWRATTCVVMKRSMGTGYAGVDNPLFVRPNTRMLFGNAKPNLDALLTALRG
jgi:NAD(P) transhydrogenase subunit beta